jgi:hypothetical protein
VHRKRQCDNAERSSARIDLSVVIGYFDSAGPLPVLTSRFCIAKVDSSHSLLNCKQTTRQDG